MNKQAGIRTGLYLLRSSGKFFGRGIKNRSLSNIKDSGTAATLGANEIGVTFVKKVIPGGPSAIKPLWNLARQSGAVDMAKRLIA